MAQVESGPTGIQRPTVDQDQPPDKHLQEREAEKTADLESLADALAAFRQLHHDLDQWERVHLARGLAAVFSGSYGAGAIEAALALTPEIERSPSAKLPEISLDAGDRVLIADLASGLRGTQAMRRDVVLSGGVPVSLELHCLPGQRIPAFCAGSEGARLRASLMRRRPCRPRRRRPACPC